MSEGEGPFAVSQGLAVRRPSRRLQRGVHRVASSGRLVAARVGMVGDPRRIDVGPSRQRGDDAAVHLAPISLTELGLDSQSGDLVPEGEGPLPGDEHTTIDTEIDVGGQRIADRVDEPPLGPAWNDRDRVDDGSGRRGEPRRTCENGEAHGGWHRGPRLGQRLGHIERIPARPLVELLG